MTTSIEASTASYQVAAPSREDVTAVADLIFRTGTAFDGFTSQMRRAYDLNAHERLALAALWSHGPLTMTDLGSWIPLSRAAVTTLVDRMEEYGLVRRGSDASDRRRTVVELTPEATERMVPVLEPWGADLAQVLGSLADEEWTVIHQFLQSMRGLHERHANRLRAMGDEEIQALAVSRA
ncbi:MAG: transcriptional regulator [Thermoleophilia bacterium]|nr:transcriptional regulator [Thermoleophilia bacterium]